MVIYKGFDVKFRMEQEKGKLTHNPSNEMREIFSEFLAEVVKLEELATVGRRFLICYQQALEFLRRPSIHETSNLVQSILKSNETKRVKSYMQAGCVNFCDTSQNTNQLCASLSSLRDHLTKANGIINELETLMKKAAKMDFITGSEHEDAVCETEEVASRSLDGTDFASFMAVIYGMVKQDYVMQERVICSLSLKLSAGELDSYSLMWSLRPFVNDDIVHQALRHVR